MNELSLEIKKEIVEANINRINQQIYDAVINHRVMERVADEKGKKNAEEILNKLEKQKDVFVEILNEFNTPKKE